MTQLTVLRGKPALATAVLIFASLALSGVWGGTCPNVYNINTEFQPLLASEDMPAARPPPWKYCGLSCAKRKITLTADNQLIMELWFKPIRGLTPEMMEWFFNGGLYGDWTNPTTGKTFSRFLWWHPRDHVYQKTVQEGTTPNKTVGQIWQIAEILVSKAKTGFLSADDPCKWSKQFYTNGNLTVEVADNTQLLVAAYESGAIPGSGTTVTVRPLVLNHKYAAGPKGLVLNSTFTVGLSSATAPPELLPYVGFINGLTLKGFGGSNPPGAGKAWQQHAIQEMTNLRFFLPQLYNASKS